MKGSVIKLDIGWWTKERLMYHTSKVFGLTTKPGSQSYALNSKLCDLAMIKFCNSQNNISLDKLNNFLSKELKKLLATPQEKLDKNDKQGSRIYRF